MSFPRKMRLQSIQYLIATIFKGSPGRRWIFLLGIFVSLCAVKNDSILHITDEHLLQFIRKEIPNSTSGSKSRTMRAVKLLSEYFRKNQINTHNLDFTYVHLKDRSDTLIEPFTAEKITKMLNTIDTSDPVGLRDYAIILLAFDTGLRAVDAFASRNIIRWIDEGKDVMSLMPFLSEYMGHSSLHHTLYYIHLIPDRLRNTSSMKP